MMRIDMNHIRSLRRMEKKDLNYKMELKLFLSLMEGKILINILRWVDENGCRYD